LEEIDGALGWHNACSSRAHALPNWNSSASRAPPIRSRRNGLRLRAGLQCDLTVQAVGAAPSVFTLSAENVYSAPTATLSSGGKTACQLQNVSDPPQSYEFKDTEPCGETQLGEILISTDGANVSGSATLVTGAKALISGSCQALYGA
jgi:hypothetical protein